LLVYNDDLGEPLRCIKKTTTCVVVFLFARVGLFAVRFAHTFAALRAARYAHKVRAATIPLAANAIKTCKNKPEIQKINAFGASEYAFRIAEYAFGASESAFCYSVDAFFIFGANIFYSVDAVF
jgi:hypothetical protein